MNIIVTHQSYYFTLIASDTLKLPLHTEWCTYCSTLKLPLHTKCHIDIHVHALLLQAESHKDTMKLLLHTECHSNTQMLLLHIGCLSYCYSLNITVTQRSFFNTQMLLSHFFVVVTDWKPLRQAVSQRGLLTHRMT